MPLRHLFFEGVYKKILADLDLLLLEASHPVDPGSIVTL
jgi:hypothetical protein